MMTITPLPTTPLPTPAARLGLVLLVFVAAPLAVADVYKGVGPDGRIFYSDQPIDGAEEVPLPDLPPSADAPPAADDQPASAGGFESAGLYTSLEILTPTEGETIRDDERRVRVSLLVEPPVQDGHRISIEVDGTPIRGISDKATQVQLRALPLGSHRLQARVLDGDGSLVAQSRMVHFHMRRPLPNATLP